MTPHSLKNALWICALLSLSSSWVRAEEPKVPIATDPLVQPIAPMLPAWMYELFAFSEDFIPPPPPREEDELPQPPPAQAGAVEQDAEGSEEVGVAPSDRSICPNPQILNSQLVIHHIYVGQGDATFIRTPGGALTILIDGGEMGHQVEVASTLKRCYGLNAVDYIVLTHPHSDHFGGLLELLKRTPEGIQVMKAKNPPPVDFAVNRGIFVTGFDPRPIKGGNPQDKALGVKLQKFLEIANLINKRRGVPETFLPFGTSAFVSRLGNRENVKFNVIVRNGEVPSGENVNLFTSGKKELKEPNATSSGIHISFGTFDYFTAGDLTAGKASEPDVEGLLVKSKLLKKMDVVKANHHGSDTSNGKEFLNAVDPFLYLVTVGDTGQNRNSFHLPRIAPILSMHAQVAKKGGFVVQSSCGAGNVMPVHPFCNSLLPLHEAVEREKAKAGKLTFNYRKGIDDDGREVPGGLRADLPNFLNAQGDMVVTTDGTQYFMLVPHNPKPQTAPRLVRTGDDGMPIQMPQEAPVALGPFRTDGVSSFSP